MTRDANDTRPGAPIRRHEGSALKAFYATKNPTKIKDSINDIRFFAKFCGCDTEEQVEALLLGPSATQEKTQRLVADYRDHLRSKNMAYGTINRRLTVIRTLVRLAKLIGVVSWEIDVPAGPRTSRRDTRGVSKRALRIAERMTGETRQARRDKAIIALAHHAQLTRAEVVSLRLDQYNPDPSAPSLSVGRRRARLNKKIKSVIDAWVEVRGLKAGPLFTSHDDKSSPMTQDEIIVLVRPDAVLS